MLTTPPPFFELKSGDTFAFLPPCNDPPFKLGRFDPDTDAWTTSEVGVGVMSRARYERNRHKLVQVVDAPDEAALPPP